MVKTKDLSGSIQEIEKSLEMVSVEQADNILGMFAATYVGGDIQTQANIRALIKVVWKRSSEESRIKVGQKYARYSGTGQIDEKSELFALLVNVGGIKYIPDAFLEVMYTTAASRLRDAHFEFDNFYHETAAARQLAELGPECPDSAMFAFIEAWMVSYIGNQYGISRGAQSYLKSLQAGFGVRHHRTLMECIRRSDDVQSELFGSRPFHRLQALLEELLPSLISAKDKEDAEYIIAHSNTDTINRFSI